MKILENESLAVYTTFKVGGPAKYFVEVADIPELKEALKFAKEKKAEVFLLAGGSNLIVSDRGFDGLVIKPKFLNIKVRGKEVTVGSGYVMDELVDLCNRKGLAGLEWAGGLPGTVGGAVRGNAGAFGGEIKDTVYRVKSLDSSSGKIVERSNKECRFGYRTSIFKNNKEIILEIVLRMRDGDPQKLKLKSLSTRSYRHNRHPMEFASAGSIFKNIPLSALSKRKQKKFEKVVKEDPFPVVPAAAVLDVAGLKGFKVGGAQVSDKHPNYIVNLGKASARDIISVINHAVKEVKAKFDIELEVEPRLLGFEKRHRWESR